jgi:hypothetical protein
MNDGKIRFTESLAKEGDEIGYFMFVAFINSINSEHQRRTPAKPEPKPPERL